MKIIDLSFNVEPNLSEPMSIKIKTRPHSGGSKFGRKIIFMGKRSLKDKAMAVIHYMSGKERITKKSFPDQEFINEQRISLSVHTGTHLDAPSHFGTRCEGKKPKTIDWILDVVLSVEKEGTKMTWIQDFSMDKNSGFTEEAVEEMINKGSKKELQIFKEKIESGIVSSKTEL